MAVTEITKAQLLQYLEEDDSFTFYGEVQHNFGDGVKVWNTYRTAIGAGDEPKGYRVVRYEKTW